MLFYLKSETCQLCSGLGLLRNKLATFTSCPKKFLLESLGLLSPKLGTSDKFTISQDGIWWCFGLCSCLNQVKFPVAAYSKSFKTLLQVNAELTKTSSDLRF